MKLIPTFLIMVLFLSGCSLMQKIMLNRMEKMSDEEKMEMMTKMMNKRDSSTCNEMMEKMSGIFLNDSLSKAEKASVMMPICLENILLTLDDDMRAQFLIDITKKIIINGYDTLSVKDKSYFKLEIMKTIEGLE